MGKIALIILRHFLVITWCPLIRVSLEDRLYCVMINFRPHKRADSHLTMATSNYRRFTGLGPIYWVLKWKCNLFGNFLMLIVSEPWQLTTDWTGADILSYLGAHNMCITTGLLKWMNYCSTLRWYLPWTTSRRWYLLIRKEDLFYAITHQCRCDCDTENSPGIKLQCTEMN